MQFHEVLYKIIIQEKQANVKMLAPAVGLPESTFYARLRGVGFFTSDEIKCIINVLPDIRLVNWFLSETNFIPVKRSDTDPDKINPLESLRRTALLMLIEASDAANQIEVALADNRIDPREAIIIKTDIETAEMAIATLREHVNRVTK